MEADAASYIERAEAEVVRWEWVADSDTLWEIPEPRTGEEIPKKILKAEPPTENRWKAVLFGYGADDRILVSRRFQDHWEGRDGGTQFGALWIESVWAEDVLLRFVHERWGPEHHRLKLGSFVHSVRDGTGRIVEVDWWFGDRDVHRRTQYVWDGGRVDHALTDEFERRGAVPCDRRRRDYEYDDQGLLRIRSSSERHAGVVWYRRSPQALRRARKLIDDELPGRIRAWAERVAPSEPVYALGIVYSMDAPELPPALALGTLAELRGWQERCHDIADFRMHAFNPGEFELFDGEPLELMDAALADAYTLLNQDWRLAENDREPGTTLRRCAKKLLQADWAEILRVVDDFVVLVVEDEIGDDHIKLVRATVPRDVLARLESLDRA